MTVPLKCPTNPKLSLTNQYIALSYKPIIQAVDISSALLYIVDGAEGRGDVCGKERVA